MNGVLICNGFDEKTKVAKLTVKFVFKIGLRHHVIDEDTHIGVSSISQCGKINISYADRAHFEKLKSCESDKFDDGTKIYNALISTSDMIKTKAGIGLHYTIYGLLGTIKTELNEKYKSPNNNTIWTVEYINITNGDVVCNGSFGYFCDGIGTDETKPKTKAKSSTKAKAKSNKKDKAKAKSNVNATGNPRACTGIME